VLDDSGLPLGHTDRFPNVTESVFDLQPVDLRTSVCIEDAFINMVPMLLESKRFDVALEAIDYYLKTFRKGKYVVDARMWRSQLPGDLVSRADEAAAAVSPAPAAVVPVAPAASTSAPVATPPAAGGSNAPAKAVSRGSEA